MPLQPCIVDTNVIVSGLIGSDSKSPPALILDAMLDGRLLYLMSDALLKEYSTVLRRPRLVRLHRLTDGEIDRLLTDLVANAMWPEPDPSGDISVKGDDHLWALLASHPEAQLVTGDRLLVENTPSGASATSPRRFMDTFFPPNTT